MNSKLVPAILPTSVFRFVGVCFLLILVVADAKLEPVKRRTHTFARKPLRRPVDRGRQFWWPLRGGRSHGENNRVQTWRKIGRGLESSNNNSINVSSMMRHYWGIGTKTWNLAVDKAVTPTAGPLGIILGTARNSGRSTTLSPKKTVRVPSVPATRRRVHTRSSQQETTPPPSPPLSVTKRMKRYSPFQMYVTCMGIVTLWMLTGTLFYSYVNNWPIPQSFFYAVDAGMSIGFCTDVAETKLVSKAFTVVFILLGASVVGGALALFIQDVVEGVVERERKNNQNILTKEYELFLEQQAFQSFDVNRDGGLSKDEFTRLIRATIAASNSTPDLSDEDIENLWTKFDRIEDGVVHFAEFTGTYRGIEGLIDSLHANKLAAATDPAEIGNLAAVREFVSSFSGSVLSFLKTTWRSENRIYYIFIAWVLLGITWGMLDQQWDPITSTHFAISALATGGLTAPPVNSDGILPARSSIFCGCYCLFGIPLMAITFGHFARVLVSDHVAALEEWALTRPMTATDYNIAKQYLIKTRERTDGISKRTPSSPMQSMFRTGRLRRQDKALSPASSSSAEAWRGLRLSDFVVLQLIRQGKISVETINILKKEFELLDTDKTGLLTLQEATNWSTADGAT